MNVAPAISRGMTEADRSTSVLSTPYNTVSFTRGFGESGYKIQVVAFDCPVCGFERMVRRHTVAAELPDEVTYYCLNPNCKHFLADKWRYAFAGRSVGALR